MAKLVLRDCLVLINSVTFSDHVSSVEINMKKDDIDFTSFSGAGRTHGAGLSDTTITLNFQQDFVAASVDATLYPLWANESNIIVEIRPTSAVRSVTNPAYLAASCIMLEYMPLSGKVGELSDTSVQFMANAPGSISRLTA